jgi:hypothetical protein
LVVRDPRVTLHHNERFLDMMERYFGQPADVKLHDARPEVSYQVGATPEFTETPKCSTDAECLDMIDRVPLSHSCNQ